MRNAIRAFGLAATLLAVAAVSAWAAPGAIPAPEEGVSLTVYNQNFAVVREWRVPPRSGLRAGLPES